MRLSWKRAQDKGLEYVLKVSEDIPSVLRGDEIRVRQVMLNLINNAVKYTHEGSVSVDVSYDRMSQMLWVVVKDTGIGIRDEDLHKLFGSFQRLEEDKNRNIEGTGLGLNIAMSLTRMMEGTISVDSKYGEGTTFTAHMKQITADETPVGDFVQNISKLQEHTNEYKPALFAPSARILIVDDNEMNLEVITELLTDTMIKVTTVDSGVRCIEKLKESKYDIVLLDQMMPGMSGTQTLKMIRQEHLADDMPVIALTADAITGARESYIKEGFTDYLSKPIMYKDLESALFKYLDPSLFKTKEHAENRPVVLVISGSAETLREAKNMLNSGYKGVFVRDEEKAEKYLSGHEVAFIVRDNPGNAGDTDR